MKQSKMILALLCAGFFLSILGIYEKLMQFDSLNEGSNKIAQNTYFGPTHPTLNENELVKVEILVKDSPNTSGPQILNVTFNGQEIPLKPRDVYNNRGQASFQVFPGKYKLSWTVNRNKFIWPRDATFKEEVLISPRDLWIQILIDGEHASIH